MKLADETLCIRCPKELGLANAAGFSAEARAAMETGATHIIVDFAGTGFLDCGGIGALIALRNDAQHKHNVSVHVINPTPPVRRLLHLTQLDSLLN